MAETEAQSQSRAGPLRHWRVVWIALLLLAKPAGVARGQSGALIEDLSVEGDGSGGVVSIRFAVPVQYLRHTPSSVGDTILIQLEPLAFGPVPELLKRGEARSAPKGNALGLREVIFGQGSVGQYGLEVRFDKPVRFRVTPGGGFRNLVIRVEAKQRPPARVAEPFHALELLAYPAGERPPDPAVALEPGERLYRVPFAREGGAWERIQIGFFRDAQAALARKRSLAAEFPGARVLLVTEEEHARADRFAFEPVPPPEASAPVRSKTEAFPVVEAEVDALMREAREALTAGDPNRAIPVLTKVLARPEHAYSAEAKELLGVARERNGQLAHAKKQYEEYLERYSGTEGAERVRQRLEAMLTAAKPGRERLPGAPRRERAIRYDVFGSVSTFYRYDVHDIDPVGRVVTDSSLHSDFFSGLRARLPRVDLRSEFSMSYLADFLEGGEDEKRFRSAFVELTDREGPLSGHLGRRSANRGGVIERFDGGRIRYGFPNEWGISAVAGFPVSIFSSNQFRTDKRFAGLSFDFNGFEKSMSGEFFGIAQQAYGFLDRAAIGSELRYFKNGRSLAALVDFDVYFLTLNTAFLTAFWPIDEATHLNLLLDYRTSPVLTTSSAVIGQGAEDLGDLDGRFSQSELKKLAKDRTSTSKLANLGITHQLSPRWQISSDLSVSSFGSTEDSRLDPDQIDPFDPFALSEISGTGSVGPDYALYTQLIGNGLFKQGDVGIVGLRLQKGDPTDFVTLILNSRYPVVSGFRVNPLVRVDYRSSTGDSETIALRPTLRLEYRFRRFTLDLRGDFLWEQNFGSDAQADEVGYTATVGVRYDF